MKELFSELLTTVRVRMWASIVLETRARKERPASLFPFVAKSDDDVTGKLQGIVGN